MNKPKRSTREAVDGLLLLDKPAGVTSNGALQKAKWLMNAKKAGHTGSLDPIATGLLPLCFGEATKLSSYLLESDKTYETTVQLGEVTETGDREGEVVQKRDVTVHAADIEQALKPFRGDILQTPPMYSALKRDGQPLYKLARQGIVVEREARPITVHELELTGFDAEAATADLRMRCSSGFYVRSLAHDLGEALGCGGHVKVLRRTAVAGFDLSGAITIDDLEAIEAPEDRRTHLMAPDRGLDHIPPINLSVDAAFYICRGQPVNAGQAGLATDDIVRLYAPEAGFLGIGTVLDDGRVAPKRLFALR